MTHVCNPASGTLRTRVPAHWQFTSRARTHACPARCNPPLHNQERRRRLQRLWPAGAAA